MASTSNRRLEQLRATARANEIKTMKLLAQSQQTRNTSKADILKKHHQNDKRVVNSFTELVGSKRENECKNTLVYNILVRKIRGHLVDSGRCEDDKAVDIAAKKMAAFVSDVMKETYKNQKLPRRTSVVKPESKEKSNTSNLKSSVTNLKMKDRLPRIPEESKVIRKLMTRPTEQKVDKKRGFSSSAFVPKVKTPPTCKQPQTSKSQPKEGHGDSAKAKSEKEKLNNWLNDVSDRTKKWSEWIKDTVDKAESSKRRINSGEDLREVSKDWKKFMSVKKEQSRQLNESFTDVRRQLPADETFRKRGQESIQQWLLKNKLNASNDRSNRSVQTASSESLFSVWSSRGPSSIFGGESDYRRLKQLGMVP